MYVFMYACMYVCIYIYVYMRCECHAQGRMRMYKVGICEL
jgi:hypothetical protein